jgi:hypothetical protein
MGQTFQKEYDGSISSASIRFAAFVNISQPSQEFFGCAKFWLHLKQPEQDRRTQHQSCIVQNQEKIIKKIG